MGILCPPWNAQGRTRQNEALYTFRFREDVVDSQLSAPGVPQYVNPREVKLDAQLCELLDEPLYAPERRILGSFRATGTELVIAANRTIVR